MFSMVLLGNQVNNLVEMLHISKAQAGLVLQKNGWDVDRSVSAYFTSPQSYEVQAPASGAGGSEAAKAAGGPAGEAGTYK